MRSLYFRFDTPEHAKSFYTDMKYFENRTSIRTELITDLVCVYYLESDKHSKSTITSLSKRRCCTLIGGNSYE